MEDKKMKRRNRHIFFLLTILLFIFNNDLSIIATNEFSTISTEFMTQDIPDEVTEYFNSVYEDAVNAYIVNSDFDSNVKISELKVEKPFIILDETQENFSEIWYYPVYYNNNIQFLVEIYIYQNNLYCGISQEYVAKLNEINYNSDMRIVKGKENIYAIDEKNNEHILENNIEGSTSMDVESFSELSNLESNKLSFNSVDSTSSRFNPKGPVKEVTNGYECDMTNCFVKQYNYQICWAASMATMIRYLRPENGYIVAGDVAYAVGDALGIDTSTNEGKVACLVPRSNDDVQLGLVLYEIYYSIVNRKLTYEELKNEIKNGSPIYMFAGYYDEEHKWHGHGTVIYGYYTYGSMRYIEMWNPGSAEKQAFQYNLDGSVGYVYNNHIFPWLSTICNGAYVAK